MNTNVLVYDSQDGYFELLKKTFRYCNFTHYRGEETTLVQNFEMIIFFLNDRLELPDYVKLYRHNIPIIFGLASKATFRGGRERKGNVYFLNLDMPKNYILKFINKSIHKIAGIAKA